VKPELVAEIAFRGWTGDGLVRQGSFKGLRTDKKPSEIVAEAPTPAKAAARKQSVKSSRPKSGASTRRDEGTVEIAGVRLTHPDRILYPDQGVTKRTLAEYYLAVADKILPHLARRPISLVRCPAGQEGECFFQKHASAGFPEELRKVRIKEKSGSDEYIYIEDESGLAAAVQMGVLELHVWGSHIDTLEKPDRLVFDLDPDTAVSFAQVRKSALELRDRLHSLGLRSFAMATGGKGIHIVLPLAPKHSWDEVKDFSEAMARTLANEQPELYLAKASKAAREGRIFIDYLRNGRGATAIAPYSSRARKGAPVAWPVAWQALSRLKDAQPVSISTAVNALKRQKGDPWKGYFDIDQTLPRL
jgi:bifunctional non-homologous end joining protein LigD